MSEANKIQIGGDHYKTGGTEHWDICDKFNVPYLHSAASKYAARHRSKAGRVDVEKAIHYLEKAIETGRKCDLTIHQMNEVTTWALSVQEMSLRDFAAIQRMFTGDNARAIEILKGILERDYPPEGKGRAFTKDPLPIVPKLEDMLIPENPITNIITNSNQAQERRVPRFDGELRAWADHAGTSPWVVTESWMADLRMRRDVVPVDVWERFYVKWSEDVYKLEPFVESVLIPHELQTCYSLLTNHDGPTSWLLEIGRVPAALREYFPRLPREVNYVQLQQSPAWWRALYREEETKWVLTNEAWHGAD